MPHQIYGNKLSRSSNHRQSLFKNLVRGMVLHGSVTTTRTKATSIRGTVDHLITDMKNNPMNGSRAAVRLLNDRSLVKKLLHEVVPVFAGRPGGFTRMIPLGPRSSDNASMVRMEWVEEIKSGVSRPTIDTAEKKSAKKEPIDKKLPSKVTRRAIRPAAAKKRAKQ